MLSRIIDHQYLRTILLKGFQQSRQSLSNCKVSIEALEIILILVEPIPVVYFADLMGDNSACFIDMHVYLEGMEISSNYYSL